MCGASARIVVTTVMMMRMLSFTPTAYERGYTTMCANGACCTHTHKLWELDYFWKR